MSDPARIAIDLLAVALLAFAFYYPRYGRRDIVVAIVGLNVGVMAVAFALASANVSAGLGLGLFGVLSIIRLRSSELDQEEVAYYFSALAIGLLAGLEITPNWLGPTLVGTIVAAIFVADHPMLLRKVRRQVVVLDRAYADEAEMIAVLEALLSGEVLHHRVRRLDQVNDSTTVDVRYRSGPAD